MTHDTPKTITLPLTWLDQLPTAGAILCIGLNQVGTVEPSKDGTGWRYWTTFWSEGNAQTYPTQKEAMDALEATASANEYPPPRWWRRQPLPDAWTGRFEPIEASTDTANDE